MSTPTPTPQKGAIYDLGYARYAGERRPPSTLWRVIMRQQLVHSWKTLWRFKLAMFVALVTTIVIGVVMYIKQTDFMEGMKKAGAPVSMLDGLIIYAYEAYRYAAFLVTLTVVAPLIARDQETGAFTFYFSRPVRGRDYVIGKLAAVGILMSIIFIAGPLLIALFRLSMASDTSELAELWPWVPKSLLIGVLAAVAYSSLPLAISALSNRRTIALGLWAAYYIVGVNMVVAVGVPLWKPLVAVDPALAISSLVVNLFEIQTPEGQKFLPPVWAAIVSLVGQSSIAIFVLFRKVRAETLGSVGGSS